MTRLLTLALLLHGCETDFERPSEVTDLRVLAIRAEPAEVLLDDDLPPVEIDALVVDPRDPEREVEARWQACGLTPELRCGEAEYALDIAHGVSPLGELSATLRITDDLRLAATEADTFRGFGGIFFVVQLALEEDGEERLDAIKQVPGIASLPPGTTENANPSPPGLLLEGEPWPEDVLLEAAPSAQASIEPTAADGDAEAYAVFRFDLAIQELEEHLGYSFFSSAGTWTREESGGPPDPVATETSLASVWTAPEEPPEDDAPVWFWIVVRDGRGGIAWTEREARIVP